MKRYFWVLVLILLPFLASRALALDVPQLKGHVNDYANILKAQERESLENMLTQYESETSNQIVILTISSLDGEVLEEYSIKVAEKWKIGQKSKDNGVIWLISKNDHKQRLEVGYGLEGKLTDLLAGRILDLEVRPLFKKSEYYAGITQGLDSVKLAIKDEYKGEDAKAKKIREYFHYGSCVGLIVVAGIFGFMHFILGGIVGAIGAPIIALYVFHLGPAALIPAIIIGFLVGLISRFILEYGVPFALGGGSGGGGGGGFGGGGASSGW